MGKRVLAGVITAATALGAVSVPAAAQSGDAAYCDASADISLLFGKIDGEPTKKQQKAIKRLLPKLEGNAPAELAEQTATAVEGVRTGDFENEAVGTAITAIDAWVAENCGFQVVPIEGIDYEFVGVPETPLERGVTVFPFTNGGAELHEIVFVRIKGDETIDELLALPEKKVDKKIEFIGAGFAEQGGTTYAYVDLKKPGRYAMVCFVPVGSTSPEAAETADGPPHAFEGMAAEFAVK